MTEPTDAELDSIDMDAKAIANQNPIGTPFAWRKAYLTALARAVLAKWGTPAGAGGKVYLVATGLTNEAGTVELYERHDKFVPLADCEALYATPQPTQAQAGAVPLTPDQVAEIADAAHREYDRLVSSGQCAPRWSAVFAHLLEQHHGVKGAKP